MSEEHEGTVELLKQTTHEIAHDKALEVSGALSELQTFLDQPKVRKQVAAAEDVDVKQLMSELALLSSRASLTVARLVHRNARTKYVG